ncbi:MAG: Hsp70 family protein [Magnetococcus sp. DMHC-6]
MLNSEPIIGIDLGTTNSEVAIYLEGRTQVLQDSEGNRLLPSFVGIDENGGVLVGHSARNQYIVHPDRTIKSIKRRMGSTDKVSMAGKEYSPQEISGIILKRLKGIAETTLGRPIHKAVITVPAFFSDAQRQATREAGEIAGLEVVRMINEPTAAALAYETGNPQNKKILVYDLGGGTFDVSVVRIENGVVEVISSHGDNHLGGDDFDALIYNHLIAHLKEKHGVDLTNQPKAIARLLRCAENAKKSLSDHPFILIEEEFIAQGATGPIHLSLELDRHLYEEMITPYIDKTLEAVHTALNGANLVANHIERILLVGGATRTPLVARRLEEVFGFSPSSEVDPDLCVAMGAAIQAAMIEGQQVSAVLVDVTPYTFGTSVLGELDGEYTPNLFVPVIRKNSSIPISRSEVFFTVLDYQESVEVNIFQGEHPDCRQNIPLGQFTITGLSHVPAHNPIVLQLDLDLNGILHVTATEKKTGLHKKITIENAFAKLDDSQLNQARQRIDDLFDEEEMNEEEMNEEESKPNKKHADDSLRSARLISKAKALIEKSQRFLDQAGEEDRDAMINLIENIQDAITSHDIERLQTNSDELADILFYLET